MLAAPPPLTDQDQVSALLRAWHAASPSSRLAPASVRIARIEPLSLLRVALTSVCEGRGVYVQPLRPTTRLPGARSVPDVDVWALDGLELPADAPVGRRTERALPGEAPCDCEACRGQGERRCSSCGGDGAVGSGRHRRQCGACKGRGAARCPTCDGKGAFVGKPIAFAEIVRTSAVRLVRDPGMPGELALALDAVLERGGGTVVLEQPGAQLPPPGLLGPAVEAPCVEAIRALLAELDGSARARVRTQQLEIRRALAFHVVRPDGSSFHAWGWPARVHPEDALDHAGALLRQIAIFAVLSALVIAGMWLVLRPG